MTLLFWDASALAKRYFVEVGSTLADALFDAKERVIMASTSWGYLETFAILLRRRNGGVITEAQFQNAVALMQTEVLDADDFLFLAVPDSLPLDSLPMVLRHNLNATDAVLLTLLKEFSEAANAPQCLLVSADQRLLRAAEAEDFGTINPETCSVADALTLLPPL